MTQQRAVPEGRRVCLFLLCDSCHGEETANECPDCQSSGGYYREVILEEQAVSALVYVNKKAIGEMLLNDLAGEIRRQGRPKE